MTKFVLTNYTVIDAPFGVVPILEFMDTGKKISSSIAIARLIAEEHGKTVLYSSALQLLN